MQHSAPFDTAYAAPFTSALALSLSASDVLDFHRSTFLDARMDAEGGDGGDGGDGGGQQGTDGTQGGPDLGFPDKTPIADMTIEQQAAYWKHHARKREDAEKRARDYDAVVAERDQLREAHSTDAEKAAATARKEGEQASDAKYQGRLVRAELKAALKGVLPDDQLADHVEFLDASKFLTRDGEVDTDKVTQYAGSVPRGGAGTQQQFPDTGGGRRDTGGGKNKAEAGKAEAAKRFGDKS